MRGLLIAGNGGASLANVEVRPPSEPVHTLMVQFSTYVRLHFGPSKRRKVLRPPALEPLTDALQGHDEHMGELISLAERRAARADADAPLARPRASFYFDLASPWHVPGGRARRPALRRRALAAGHRRGAPGRPPTAVALRGAAEERADELQMPLVWPEPLARGRAQRDARRRHGRRARPRAEFVLAASRLAFCGGFDLDDPEMLAEAAAAADLGLEDCLEAAGEVRRDGPMEQAALRLLAQGADTLPGAASSGARCSAASTGWPRPPRRPPGAASRARRRAARSAGEPSERGALTAWEDPGRCSGVPSSVCTSASARAIRGVVLAFVFLLSCFVVGGGVLLLNLYVDISLETFWRIFLVSAILVLIEVGAALWLGYRLVRAGRPWLRGERTPDSALAAWSALAGLPVDLLRFGRGIPVVLNTVPISIYVTLELDGQLPQLPGHRGGRPGGPGVYGVLPALLRHRAGDAPGARRRLARPARRRRPRRAPVPLRDELLVALPVDQRRHRRRRRRPGLRRRAACGPRDRGPGRPRRRVHRLASSSRRCWRARSSSRSRTCARRPSA